MAAITDLAAASSVAATDNLVVNQSGTDRKVTANKFAVVANANTLTNTNTFSGNTRVRPHIIDDAYSLDVSHDTLTLTAGGLISLGTAFAGFLVVTEETSGGTAAFLLGGGAVVKLGNSAGTFGTAVGSAGDNSINVYFSTTYRIINRYTGTRTLKVFSVRTRALV